MRYEVDGDELCIRIGLGAIEDCAAHHEIVKAVKDRRALALAVARELIECEDAGEEYYISEALDEALVRVIKNDDPSLSFNYDDKET